MLLLLQIASLLSLASSFRGSTLSWSAASSRQIAVRELSHQPPLFAASPVDHDDGNGDKQQHQVALERRTLFKTAFAATTAILLPLPALAESDQGDLTSQMFNADGSLKEGIESEAKFRAVNLSIDSTGDRVVCTDGTSLSCKEGAVRLSYSLPLKWEAGDNLYFDRSEGVNAKACNRILVYQAPGKVPASQLEKAARIGIAKALDVMDDLAEIETADLIGGRTVNVNGQKYFQFDMGVAPKTCEDSPENLGLGFCPFESLYLLSGTVLDDKLYVFALQCSKDQWKRANADLRIVRNTFSVQSA